MENPQNKWRFSWENHHKKRPTSCSLGMVGSWDDLLVRAGRIADI